MKKTMTLMYAEATEGAIAEAQRMDWYFIGAYRVLAYGDISGCCVLEPATDSLAASLTEWEKEWLEHTIREYAEKEARKSKTKIDANTRAFMRAFERELEAERRRQDGHEESTEAGVGAEDA